jgi:hypothetical protein
VLEKLPIREYQQAMKLGSICGVVLLALSLAAQESKTNGPVKVTPDKAKANVGTQAVVTGKIAEVNVAEKLVRLNFDKPFPNQTFTAVVFADKTNLFPGLEKLEGKTVTVKGTINEYRGRPQIILTSTNQLSVPETDSGAAADKQ